MDSLRSLPRQMDNGDPRVPMAWRHREMSFNGPYTKKHQQQQPSSPSVSSSSSADDRDEVPMVRQHYRPHSRHSNMDRVDERIDHYATIRNSEGFNSRNERRDHPQFSSARSDRLDSFSLRGGPVHDNFHGHHFRHNNGGGSTTGTLRSTRSVPALAFTTGSIDGSDPCPIHGGNHMNPMRRHGSLFDMRAPPVGGPLSLAGLDKKVFHGSKHSLINGHPPHQPPPLPPHFQQFHDPPQYMPPHMMMMRNPQHPLGIPMMLDPAAFKKGQRPVIPGYPTKNVDPYSMEQVCCKGHLIVLWIILGVVTVGVILGIIMGVTIT